MGGEISRSSMLNARVKPKSSPRRKHGAGSGLNACHASQSKKLEKAVTVDFKNIPHERLGQVPGSVGPRFAAGFYSA